MCIHMRAVCVCVGGGACVWVGEWVGVCVLSMCIHMRAVCAEALKAPIALTAGTHG